MDSTRNRIWRRGFTRGSLSLGLFIAAVVLAAACDDPGERGPESAGRLAFIRCDTWQVSKVEGGLRFPTCQFMLADPETRTEEPIGAPQTDLWPGRPSWAPNGRRLAYSTCAYSQPDEPRLENCEVRLLDLDDERTSVLWESSPDTGITAVSWSPRGDRTAAIRCDAEGRGCAMVLIDPDGGAVTELPLGLNNPSAPQWSPEGDRLAFAAESQGNSSRHIYVVRSDGSALTRVTGSPLSGGSEGEVGSSSERDVSWSPDGQRIAFVKMVSRLPEPAAWSISTVNADGSGALDVTTGGAADERIDYLDDPEWSPDGTQIAFARYTIESYVFFVNADGTGLHGAESPRERGDFYSLGWSPDGKRLAAGKGYAVFTIDIETGRTTRLGDSGEVDIHPVWSPVARAQDAAAKPLATVLPTPTTSAAGLSPSPTATSTSTATPSPTATATPSPATERLYEGGRAVSTGLGGERLNVRAGPGTGYGIVATLLEGEAVRLTSPRTAGGGYAWWGVELIDGTTGWVAEGPPDGGQTWLRPIDNSQPVPFRTLAVSVQRAVLDADSRFFWRSARTSLVACPAPDEVVACQGQPEGARVATLNVVNPFEGAGYGEEQYHDRLASWFKAARPDLSDDYGSGRAQIYSTAVSQAPDETVTSHVVVTGIFGQSVQRPPVRQVLVFSWQLVDGEWKHTRLWVSEGFWDEGYPAPVSWLSGGCGLPDERCVAWQRWP